MTSQSNLLLVQTEMHICKYRLVRATTTLVCYQGFFVTFCCSLQYKFYRRAENISTFCLQSAALLKRILRNMEYKCHSATISLFWTCLDQWIMKLNKTVFNKCVNFINEHLVVGFFPPTTESCFFASDKKIYQILQTTLVTHPKKNPGLLLQIPWCVTRQVLTMFEWTELGEFYSKSHKEHRFRKLRKERFRIWYLKYRQNKFWVPFPTLKITTLVTHQEFVCSPH